MANPSIDTARPGVPARIAGWVGLLGHIATLMFYAASGLVAPLWAVVVLMIVWLALLVLAIVLLRRRPVWTLLVPVAGIAIWFAAISAGDAWLGWTA